MFYELFFRQRQDSLQEILAVNKINTVYGFILNEMVSEVFEEMRSDSPLKLLVYEKMPKSNMTTRWTSKGVFAPIVSRTVVKKKCSANFLMKTYNWLTELHLISPNLLNLSHEQLKKHLKLVDDQYINDKKELVSLFLCLKHLLEQDSMQVCASNKCKEGTRSKSNYAHLVS